ncbi:sugar phosphate isomerase/epimerase [Candidatus Pacearchaeota archaeon]|nr:sugar phosphate isomerase/epimerase [Candidatus Pacearchaeota archaeon]
MADYNIPDIYQGGYSSLNPTYGSIFTGYRVKDTSTIGVSTDPRTANVLKDVSDKLASGQKTTELSLIDLGTPLDTITKQQLAEVRRLAKLTGVDITVHGPINDASGATQQGFDENQRQVAERKLINSIERAEELNENGNIPVTFHTSNALPGKTWGIDEKGKINTMVLPVVNQDTGQMTAVKREERYYPTIDKEGKARKVLFIPEERIESLNLSDWENNLQQVIVPKEHADRIIRESLPLVSEIYGKIQKGEYSAEELEKNPIQRNAINRLSNAQNQLKDVQLHLDSLFHKAYKYGTEEEKKYLNFIAQDFTKRMVTIERDGVADPLKYSDALQNLMIGLYPKDIKVGDKEIKFNAPQVYKPAEEYALEKTAQTFGNVAFESWKKFGSKAPIINIENPPAGGGLSTGEDLKNVIEESRKKFAEKLVKEKHFSETQAKKEAEKMIGATWDVGHINQLRRYGFTGEQILEEAKKIAPYVRHIHLSDNFGMDNIELPMGMGNVDFKETMKILGEKGEKAKKIVEAAHWWQHMQSSPFAVSLEALGAPLYSTFGMPYWNQSVGLHQGYLGGYGTMLPQINYETFGAGFSNLPMELGGQRQQTGRGRLSGTPME